MGQESFKARKGTFEIFEKEEKHSEEQECLSEKSGEKVGKEAK